MNNMQQKKSQQGSIMLEVIAVLALMGVMGAMLFRQIYQRNQELHNVQMASEIRTIKEAFSAYIQADRQALLGECDPAPKGSEQWCDVRSEDLANGVDAYLPSGWAGGTITDFYNFTLGTYTQDDDSERRNLYGLVAPVGDSIPATGWNFKRAARVALLIGADGGSYDPNVTGDKIYGTMGSWEFDVDNTAMQKKLFGEDYVEDTPMYVATTGLDVFTPEYDPPIATIKFKGDDLQWATQRLHAWEYLSVGGGTGSGCYAIGHDSANPTAIEGIFENTGDTVNNADSFSTCKPLFVVDTTTDVGRVYVNHDLEVGTDGATALRLSQEGVIRQDSGLTIDKDGRIISKNTIGSDTGDLKTNEHYILDPEHTSTMNDMRLVSRGGARLSDILPNYIFKNTVEVLCTISSGSKTCSSSAVSEQKCPTNYNKAYLIRPTSWAIDVATTQGKPESSDEFLKTATTGAVRGVQAGTDPLEADANDTTVVNSVSSGTVEASENFIKTLTNNKFTISFDGANKKVVFEYENNLSANATMKAEVDSYCVWAPSMYTTSPSCQEAGFIWEGGSCRDAQSTDERKAEISQDDCESSGFTWDSTHKRCQIIYKAAATITDAAVCKAAGYNWNPTTNTCS